MDSAVILIRRQQVLYDKKWRKFLRRSWLFRFIPFLDFALGAGSMATGAVNANSDFDVILEGATHVYILIISTCVSYIFIFLALI